ncbi:hypothetical protein BN1723_016284 [Verticillium longisporum]|uniref:Uncharacterized protein n=1 Tax=Verticillium longisporum TaxID=100787 RepID=A0A0G4NC33_VERLO|nr:hypothetical protein BN1723_016284 [Verticillium longisporum]
MNTRIRLGSLRSHLSTPKVKYQAESGSRIQIQHIIWAVLSGPISGYPKILLLI